MVSLHAPTTSAIANAARADALPSLTMTFILRGLPRGPRRDERLTQKAQAQTRKPRRGGRGPNCPYASLSELRNRAPSRINWPSAAGRAQASP